MLLSVLLAYQIHHLYILFIILIHNVKVFFCSSQNIFLRFFCMAPKERRRDKFIFTLRRQESCWVPGQVLPIFSLLVRPSVHRHLNLNWLLEFSSVLYDSVTFYLTSSSQESRTYSPSNRCKQSGIEALVHLSIKHSPSNAQANREST